MGIAWTVPFWFFVETVLHKMYPCIVPLVSSGPEKCMVIIQHSFPPALIQNHLGFARVPSAKRLESSCSPRLQQVPASPTHQCFTFTHWLSFYPWVVDVIVLLLHMTVWRNSNTFKTSYFTLQWWVFLPPWLSLWLLLSLLVGDLFIFAWNRCHLTWFGTASMIQYAWNRLEWDQYLPGSWIWFIICYILKLLY